MVVPMQCLINIYVVLTINLYLLRLGLKIEIVDNNYIEKNIFFL